MDVISKASGFICAAFTVLLVGSSISGLRSQTVLYKKWQVEDGLPQNSVNQVLQTKDGYLWLATHGGLVRFDGVKFKIFDLSNTPELKSNRVMHIADDETGQLYINTAEGGLTICKDLCFTNISKNIPNFPKGNSKIDSQGRLWIITFHDNQVQAFDRKTFQPVTAINEALKNTLCRTMFETPEGEIILEYGNKTTVWKDGILSPDSMDYRKLNARVNSAVYNKQDGVLWFVSTDTLYQMYQHRIKAKYVIPKSYPRGEYLIRSFLAGPDKLLFIGYNEFEPIAFNTTTHQFSTEVLDFDCMPSILTDVMCDREGNIWYATTTCGLIKEGKFPVEFVDTDPRIMSHNMYPVMQDSKGRIFIGSANTGAYIIENGRWVNTRPFKDLPRRPGFSKGFLEIGPDDYLFIFNHFSGVMRIKKGVLTRHTCADVPTCLYQCRSGEVLLPTRKGYFQWTNNSIQPYTVMNGLGNISVSEFFEDSQDNLWVLTLSGLFRYDKSRQQLITFDTLNRGTGKFLRGAHEDTEGRIYFGSYGYGLIIYEHGKFTALNMQHGLIENVVSTISEDNKDNIWLTGNKGLTKLKKQQVLATLRNSDIKLSPVLYDKSDGFRNAEFNGGNQQSKYHLGNGVYLFPMLEGCIKIDLNAMPENTVPPPVMIETIVTEDSTYLPSGDVRIPYSKGRIEFNYTALSFVSPKNVKFKYKLEGYDHDWVEAGTERKTSYTKLSPGTYTFRVIACNNDNLWNEAGSTVSLKIIPPFFMTWWFRTLLVLILGMLLSVVAILAYRRTKKKEYEKAVLMDVLPDMILKVNSQGKYVDIYGNPSALSRPFSEIKGRTIREILPAGFSDTVFEKITETIATRQVQRMEYQMPAPNGKTRNFEGRFVYINRHEALYIIRDITDAKEAENKIRESEKRLGAALEEEKKLKDILKQRQRQELKSIVNTEERERKRIAADLHDSVGQLLSSVKINLGTLNRNSSSFSDHERALIENSKHYLQEITQEIRNFSYNLLPSSLNQFGLVSTMEDEIKNNSLSTLQIQFIKSLNQERFDPEIELVIYRVFQEILNNVLKHAQASELVIQLIQHENALQLIAEDNGKGFEVEQGINNLGSSGLKNLHSRVKLLHGTISIDSTPLRGTTIIAEIPLNENRNVTD